MGFLVSRETIRTNQLWTQPLHKSSSPGLLSRVCQTETSFTWRTTTINYHQLPSAPSAPSPPSTTITSINHGLFLHNWRVYWFFYAIIIAFIKSLVHSVGSTPEDQCVFTTGTVWWVWDWSTAAGRKNLSIMSQLYAESTSAASVYWVRDEKTTQACSWVGLLSHKCIIEYI